uniref:Uncharacterized protein n=1 Tax=Panagrolaimus superbus TaxID=310955 RepID=A0A914XYF3_9BILA
MAAFVDTVLPVLDEYGPQFLPKFNQLRVLFPVRFTNYVKNTQCLRRKIALQETNLKEIALKHLSFGVREAQADILAIFKNEPGNCMSNAVFSKMQALLDFECGGGKKFSFGDSSVNDISSEFDHGLDNAEVDEKREESDNAEEEEEEVFNLQNCLPTSNVHGIYSTTANFQLERSIYSKILRTATQNVNFMCDGNVKEHPKGGTLLVVNIKNAQNKVTPPLPLLKAEIECRTDGYRWGLNQDDPKQHVNFR